MGYLILFLGVFNVLAIFSDSVILGILGLFGTIATGIFQLMTLKRQVRSEKKQDLIHIQIDGMKDDLINATRLAGEGVGAKQGRADERMDQLERDKVVVDAKAVSEATPVIVVGQDKPIDVNVKKG